MISAGPPVASALHRKIFVENERKKGGRIGNHSIHPHTFLLVCFKSLVFLWISFFVFFVSLFPWSMMIVCLFGRTAAESWMECRPPVFSDGACAPLCAHECREETKRQSKGATTENYRCTCWRAFALSLLFFSCPFLFENKKNLFTNKRGTERTNERGQQTNWG